MKKTWLLLIVLSLILSLAGCASKDKKSHALDKNGTFDRIEGAGQKHTDPIEPETTVPTTVPPTTEPPTTAPPTTLPPPTAVSYLQKIDRPDQEVYSGPGYEYTCSRVIGEEGTFTIVEEAWDNQGNLWGKLKSGIGWVNLSQIRGETASHEPIEADYADSALLNSGNYHHCVLYTDDYVVEVVFRANEVLTKVEIYDGVFGASDMVPGELLFSLPELTPSKSLVAEASFPGDLSTYFIQFNDSHGVRHCYSVYMSGYDGSLVCSKVW